MATQDQHDEYFLDPSSTAPFQFNADVVAVFDDMVSRSVPYYQALQYHFYEISKRFIEPGGQVYDLGCSTGTTALIFDAMHTKPFSYLGLDKSAPMIQKAEEKCKDLSTLKSTFIEGDLETFDDYQAADFILLNLVLQFIPIEKRLGVLQKIYHALKPGKALCMVEKVAASGELLNELFTDAYDHFKEKQGYSSEEIQNKKQALKTILTPLTIEENKSLLLKAGFTEVDSFFQAFNFCGFIAIKTSS